ncbi:MAG: hypothetical protein LBJ62_06240 [Bifidobacteriaceae bacterium]|jgi:hypothetical protein|nr:hypothetical protein [Bifidobacteriaceae bacterium]
MYGWLWRHLPGPWFVKVFFLAALAAAVVAVCFIYFFPWVSPYLPFNNVTIEDGMSPEPSISQVYSPTPSPGSDS